VDLEQFIQSADEAPEQLLKNSSIAGMIVRLALSAQHVADSRSESESKVMEFYDSPDDLNPGEQALYELGYTNGLAEAFQMIASFLQGEIEKTL
jgi:hypothetical protein